MGMSTAERLAKAILNGFHAYFAEFENITLAAQARFEQADWASVHHAMRERLDLYKVKVRTVAEVAHTLAGEDLENRSLWQQAKADFAELVRADFNYEIAQSFFNSVYCYVFGHERVKDMHAFVIAPEQHPADFESHAVLREFRFEGDIHALVRTLITDYAFNLPFEDLERDVARVVEVVRQRVLKRFPDARADVRVQALDALFYRNKGAYLVGGIYSGRALLMPFVLPFLNNEQGAIYVDTAIFDSDDVSIIFSFTRSYFMVDAAIPSRYVAFLKRLMPHKEIFELYNALGFSKHGKTEFYRFAVAHTRSASDEYVTAPGIKGMVMLVFTRPNFEYVYKVIKERFTPPKDMTREQVREKYRLVKRWDLAGRMADTQEFTNLAFDRSRFSSELMEELHREVPSLVEERGRALILKHVYIERKMIPLNLYLRDLDDERLQNVMDEYGNAIKQLAGANIFPGDMLLKNFGVTRHGRVVFYDYDEICPLTECNFRALPAPRNDADEFASQPWYSVAANDVFPEEFRLFFSGNARAKQVFDSLHGELYDPAFWCGLQDKLRAGIVQDVFPYRRRIRFPRLQSPAASVLDNYSGRA